MKIAAVLALGAAPCAAQFQFMGNMFRDMHQQRQEPQPEARVNNLVENTYVDLDCARYVCEDTLKCVDTPQDCPCPFPDSQLKCEFPDRAGYVCISQPSNADGPTCDYVLQALAGNL